MEIQTPAQQKKSAKEMAMAMATTLLPNGPDTTDQLLNT